MAIKMNIIDKILRGGIDQTVFDLIVPQKSGYRLN